MNKTNKQQVPKIRFEGFSDKWSDKVIGDIADIKRGASPRPISDPKWFNDNSAIGWVRISDVTRSFRVLEKTEQYLSDEGVKKSRLIKSGSIIMSICATIGKPVYTAFDVCIHDGFVVFDDLKIDADYTLYFLQTIQDKWYQYGQPGTQVNLNSDIVSNENIKYPSLEEQTQIGNFFQQLDQLIELQTRAVESAESYKKAMLQKMFPQKGETVPRVRFEGFSEDWSEKIIGDIANIKRGASPRPISDPKWFDDSSSIGWVRISDVTRSFRVLEETEQYLSELGIKKSRLIKSGSIIMSICATIGKPVYTAFDVCIHDGFVVFDDLKIDKDYMLYFLQTIQEKWYQYGQPGTQVNLNSDIVSQEKIVFPSLEEQTSIGNFFQKLDQNIATEKKKLEQYQTMKRAMLQRMFV